MLEAMRSLTPTHVVFNGAVGALTGANALTAKVGDKVLFIHASANRDTRPHLIGGHGDLVWNGGSFADKPATNLETWFVPGGSATAALYEFRQPGLYVYLNHNLIEAILLGAAAHINVEGYWDNNLMEQVLTSTPVAPTSSASTTTTSAAGDLVGQGEILYKRTAGGMGCAACHGADASGSVGPNVRGKSAHEIDDAIKRVSAMSFIRMSDDDIQAVAAYLKYLQSK